MGTWSCYHVGCSHNNYIMQAAMVNCLLGTIVIYSSCNEIIINIFEI